MTRGHRGLSRGENYVVGLGARPSRAGSISRELLDSYPDTAFPPKKAGGFKPAPSAEMPVLMVPSGVDWRPDHGNAGHSY